MTAQIPESLDNEHPRLNLGPLLLYGVVTGDPRNGEASLDEYEHVVRPAPPRGSMCSANWKRYIGCYRIDASGHLVLDRYAYPFTDASPTPVGETLTGDFMLSMKEDFYASSVFVPFRAGVVVENPREWLVAKRTGAPASKELIALLGR